MNARDVARLAALVKLAGKLDRIERVVAGTPPKPDIAPQPEEPDGAPPPRVKIASNA